MINRLDEIIGVLKSKYPLYKFINASRESVEGLALSNNYAIVVKNIPEAHIRSFIAYVNDNIFTKIAETDEELPLLIPLQICDVISMWKFSLNCNPIVLDTEEQECSSAAEDYNYSLAA